MKKKIKLSQLSVIKMVSVNENKYPVVIVDGKVKEWVGIGWIDLREATKEDYEKYPEAIE